MPDASSQAESAAAIDRICDEFERAWQRGDSPSIEACLSQVPPAESATLLGELLQIEFEYRLRSEMAIDLIAYLRRFPDQAAVVQESLAAASKHARRPTARDQLTPRDPFETQLWNQAGGAAAGAVQPVRLGDYEILDELGRGGMGVVYRARQFSVDRLVALKVIHTELWQRLPLDQHDSISHRFVNEVTAVARLEHDHVVTAYGAGQSGPFHYYAMRLVDGSSLAELLRAGPAAPRQAAEWLAGIARALAAAHEQGILHRDVKPANILIDRASQRALLVDFGLAKLLAGASDFTQSGELLGSPPYMSPEQATDSSRVGPAADIYSLGAALYHALTGRPPFQAGSPTETLRQVIDDPPLAPRRLNPSVPVDLETICLKCLEKQPQLRYASAAEAADDLDRFLRDEPIRARPVNRFQRIVRWCRRHPLPATLAATTALLVVATFVSIVVGLSSTYFALQAERRERARAEENLQLARQSVDTFLHQLSGDPRLKSKGLEKLRQELLAAATTYYDTFARQKGTDDQILAERGRALGSLGSLTAELGDSRGATTKLTAAVEVFDDLRKRQPAETSHARELVALHAQLAGLFHDTGQPAPASKHCDAALALCQDQLQLDPQSSSFRRLLARCLLVRSRLLGDAPATRQAAITDLQQASVTLDKLLAESPQDAQLQDEAARCRNNLAILHRRGGELDKAERHTREALALWSELARQSPLATYCEQFGLSANNLALILLDREQPTEAGKVAKLSLKKLTDLVAEHPDVPDYADHLAAVHSTLARWHEAEGRWDEAAQSLQTAVSHYDRLTVEYPGYFDYQFHLASALNNLGGLLANSSALNEAERSLARADRLFQQLIAAHPDRPQLRPQHALVLASLAGIATELGEHRVAASYWEDALPFATAERRGEWQIELARAYALCAAAAEHDRALSDAQRQELVQQFAKQAFSQLEAARRAGQLTAEFSTNELEQGEDFAALRAQGDLWNAWRSSESHSTNPKRQRGT